MPFPDSVFLPRFSSQKASTSLSSTDRRWLSDAADVGIDPGIGYLGAESDFHPWVEAEILARRYERLARARGTFPKLS